ncbi:folate-binding protein YgfZ [Lysobacter niabensis]|uniref:Folate-binding protein YgfZ n=1 Tax=Agrilutibacter niabensis TaxID=380628 RepID=A0ABU1VLA6_9GAMM|nr:folate-binding protein [Lysobacter niabensis]MDR7098266.1 folate-binding protein YgfZ [Lysobacter niabensis]
MHDNPQAAEGLAFALPDHRVIALSGRDAAVFAQAQFMNDLKTLAPGRWHWSGWLTPKGRVIALFALLKLDEETLWLLLPDADPVTLAAALQRFVFRSKVGIAVRDDLHVEGAFAPPAQARGADIGGDAGAGVELDFGADAGARTLRILSVSTALHDPALGGRWAAFDLRHGLPRLPASQTDHWTPQQLSLDRINAFSVKKGCYPGQEIVARTHFLGKVKRGLALLEADSALHAGEDLRAAGAPLGHVVACADDGNRHLALAVVPLERAAAPLQVGDTDVWESPLGEGLAR